MENIISNHNRKLMKTNTVSHSIKKCNCIDTNFCPLQGNCVQSSVVYKADVTTSTSTSTYIGLASNTFKERYNNHLSTLRYKHKENHTTLSKYIWQLKSEGIQYDIKWSIIGHAPAYNKVSKKCHLCLLEKTNIIMSRNSNSLNKRTEIMNKCRHREKHLLSSVGPAVWKKNIFFLQLLRWPTNLKTFHLNIKKSSNFQFKSGIQFSRCWWLW